jgi:hypothetical protein
MLHKVLFRTKLAFRIALLAPRIFWQMRPLWGLCIVLAGVVWAGLFSGGGPATFSILIGMVLWFL